MSKRLKVFVTRRLPESVEARLADLFDADLRADDGPLPREALIEGARDADAVAATLGDQLDAAFFENAGERLKLVANFGAGVDHIDIAAAHARGVIVTNTPSVQADDAADMAMALILAAPRRLVEGVRAVREDRFEGWSPTWMLGRRLGGAKLGVIGLGRVGEAVARRARAFGLSVHYHNRTRINPHMEETLEATYHADLDEMLSRVDIVSVNCPLTPETRGLLSRERLARMPAHAHLVNISRSEVIDQEALADFLEAGRIAGAGLDVFARDGALDRLRALPNVVLLPHMASATHESREEMGARLIINVKMFADGHKPPDRVIWGLHADAP